MLATDIEKQIAVLQAQRSAREAFIVAAGDAAVDQLAVADAHRQIAELGRKIAAHERRLAEARYREPRWLRAAAPVYRPNVRGDAPEIARAKVAAYEAAIRQGRRAG